MEVDEYGTMVRTFERRLYITVFNPGKYALCDENVIYASPIICLPRRNLGVPTCRGKKKVASEKGGKRDDSNARLTCVHSLPARPK